MQEVKSLAIPLAKRAKIKTHFGRISDVQKKCENTKLAKKLELSRTQNHPNLGKVPSLLEVPCKIGACRVFVHMQTFFGFKKRLAHLANPSRRDQAKIRDGYIGAGPAQRSPPLTPF